MAVVVVPVTEHQDVFHPDETLVKAPPLVGECLQKHQRRPAGGMRHVDPGARGKEGSGRGKGVAEQVPNARFLVPRDAQP